MKAEVAAGPGGSPRWSAARLSVWAAVGAAAGLGWWLLWSMVAAVPPDGRAALGPLMDLFGGAGVPAELARALAVLCTPAGAGAPVSLLLADAVLMWGAMMLPSAMPTFLAFADRPGGAGAPPRLAGTAVVAAGYLSVWLVFAFVAAGLQVALVRLGTLSPALTPVTAIGAATTLIAAGLYQFSSAKVACLDRCRHPREAAGLARERTAGGLFRLGLEEGIACLGCCAALMAAMFAVGLMNLVWMAILTVLMAAEKATPGDGLRRAIGVGLVGWGAALVAASPAGRALLGI